MTATNCCVSHDVTLAVDPVCATLTQMYSAGAQLVQGGQPVSWGGQLAFVQFAPTQALTALAAQRPAPTRHTDGTQSVPILLKVSTMKLCKQHTTGQCKLGAMCRNIHLCRQVAGGTTAPAAAAASPYTGYATRCESADRGGLRLPPLVAATSSGGSMRHVSRGAVGALALPQISAGSFEIAPVQSSTSPLKSARSSARRLSGGDASNFRPAPPAARRSIVVADVEDTVMVNTPVPTPPPCSPVVPPQVSTGSGCFRRFAKRWNEPMKGGSGVISTATPNATPSATASIDLETVQENVNVLAVDQVLPLPPTNSSGEGRCYARRSAFDAKDGCFSVFSN